MFVIHRYRNEISHDNLNATSLPIAYDWLDKTSLYLSYLRGIQSKVNEDVIQGLQNLAKQETKPILGGLSIMFIISIVYPLMVRNIKKVIRDINDYTETMLDQCNILNEVKRISRVYPMLVCQTSSLSSLRMSYFFL